jgi:hypothetical protein
MWPPNSFKTNLSLVPTFSTNIAAPGPKEQLESPHNRLVYRFLQDSADWNFIGADPGPDFLTPRTKP